MDTRLLTAWMSKLTGPPKTGKPLRVRVKTGEFAGESGYCYEADRFGIGEFGPGGFVPVDLDERGHRHIKFEDVELTSK